MTRLLSTGACLTLAVFVSLASVGCRDSSSSDFPPPPTNGNAGPPASGPNPGGPPGTPAQQPGVVSQLTGDPDDQVSPQLQQLVAAALQRGDTDAPLEGF